MAHRGVPNFKSLLNTSAWSAVAAAVAFMAVPAEALAQNSGRYGDWQRGGQSQSSSNRQSDSSSRARSSDSSSRGAAAARVENRGERNVRQVENRSDRRSAQPDRQGDRSAVRATNYGNYQRAQRADNQRPDNRPERSARQNDQRSEQRPDRGRDRNDDRYRGNDSDRGGVWQRNRANADQNRNRDYRDDRRDDRRDYRRDDRRDDHRYSDKRDYRRWDRDWRRSDRYDWQRYRKTHRHIYHGNRYYAPYRNYRYSRLSIGFHLDSLFYSSRYWINDPYYYRLPPAYGPYRWVRYYDDALLVNVYTGQVVDVIHDFFW